jgi:hypothetical protein
MIWTWDLQNTNQELYRVDPDIWYVGNVDKSDHSKEF